MVEEEEALTHRPRMSEEEARAAQEGSRVLGPRRR